VVVAVGTDSLTLDLPTTAVANQGVVGAETYGTRVSRAATQAIAGTSVSATTAGLQAGMRVYDNTVAGAPVLLGTIAAIVDANTLTLSAATTVARSGDYAFYQGDIKGAGNFEKTGGGLLQLDVPLSLTGLVNLTGGTLKLNTAATFATATHAQAEHRGDLRHRHGREPRRQHDLGCLRLPPGPRQRDG